MRLAGAKIRQVHTRSPQLRSLGSHSHRRRNLNPTNPVGKHLALRQNRSRHIVFYLYRFPAGRIAKRDFGATTARRTARIKWRHL